MKYFYLWIAVYKQEQVIMARVQYAKVRLFLDRSWGIISSFKIVVIFNNKSADFALISADGTYIKMTPILKELRI